MNAEENRYLLEFYRAVRDEALDPDSPEYVGIYDDPTLGLEDPVMLLARSIQWSPGEESTQLFSGFRGSGKSTELRRLRRELTDNGYLVVLFDVFDYLSASLPLDVSDFLMVVAGALSDTLEEAGVLADGAARESYWSRLTNFLATRIEFDEIVAGLGPLQVKASLAADPTFRQRLQARAAGHLIALVEDMRAYVQETITAIAKDLLGSGLVLLVDSIENIAGTISNAQEVQESVERLFTSHADHLQLPRVHVVYTVPPWLNIRAPGVAGQYSGGLQMLHPLKVREPTEGREPVEVTLEVLCKLVGKRGEWQRLLGDRATFDEIALESGGHLRDLLRAFGEIIRRADQLPANRQTIDRGINQLRSELLPIAEDDALWLRQIAETRDVSLRHIDRLPRLVTFLDSHLVLCYRNGEDWYDVHPLVRREVTEIAERAAAAAADRSVASDSVPIEEAIVADDAA